MAMDMLKRSLELLSGSAANTARNYFSNADQLFSDTKQIYSTAKDVVKKPFDFVRGMLNKSRGGGIYKLVTDWFYQRNSEFDKYDLGMDDSDDDFDAGMGDMGDDEEDSTPSATIDTKSMKDIARGQVGAMYQIGQKQVEASLSNTSEIVSSLNNRAAEIVTAINNMNKSVINIDKNLAALVGSQKQSNGQYTQDDEFNMFSGGQLTLGKMFGALKQAASENMYLSLGSTALERLKQAGPSFITDSLMDILMDNLKLGGTSLREHADTLNEKLGNFMHNQFSKLLDWDKFKDWVGDFGFLSNKIGGHVANDYNNKKATFDGMTRKTIVEIIPAYLQKITKALTGETYNINRKGKLTTENTNIVQDTMQSTVTSSAFGYDTLSKGVKEGKINTNRNGINDRLLSQMQEWLTQGYVAYCFENYNRIMPFEKLLDPTIREFVIGYAWDTFMDIYNGNAAAANETDFKATCRELLDFQLFSTEGQAKFEKGIQAVINSMHKAGQNLATEGIEVNDRVDSSKIREWAKGKYIHNNVYQTLTQDQLDQIRKDLESGASDYAQEFNAAKRLAKERRNSLGGILAGKKKEYEASQEARAYEALTDAEKTDFKNKGFVDDNGILTEKGVLELVARRVALKTSTDVPGSNPTVEPNFYTGDPNRNIGSLVFDIYKHLTEGVTKVEVVGFVSQGGNKGSNGGNQGGKGKKGKNKNRRHGKGGIPSRLNLNMHGCGPVALTDLASRMENLGLYDPERGTSVGDYISTASSMGMDLHPGQATQRALLGTSPTHPTTVLGSGYGFGTGTGQLHYMNVVGSDGKGNVYTSNPMYGDGKYPVGAIANNSIMGLYGSGDGDPNQEINTTKAKESVEEAKNKLKEKVANSDQDTIVGKVLTLLFGGDTLDNAAGKVSSGIDTVAKHVSKGKGLFGSITGKVNDWVEQTRTNVSDDIKNGLDTAIANVNHHAKVVKEGNEYADRKKQEVSGDATISDEDKQLASQALSLMQGALTDGDGESDLGAIKKVINKIKNDDLRNDLLNNVTGLINRSKQKATSNPKSGIGKFILMGFGLIKKFLSPVFKGIKLAFKGVKTLLSKAFEGVKKYGKRILKFLAAPYIKGATMISTGASAVKEGLFGKKETLADGTVMKTNGIFGEVKEAIFGGKTTDVNGDEIRKKGLIDYIYHDIKTVFKGIGTGISKIGKGIGKWWTKHITPLGGNLLINIKAWAGVIGGAFKKLGKKIINSKIIQTPLIIAATVFSKITGFISNIPKYFGKLKEKIADGLGSVIGVFINVSNAIKGTIGDAMVWVSDTFKKIKESKFGQGVSSAWNKLKGSKLGRQMKAIGKGAGDFGKGFIGGWRGVWKDAEQKGKENVDKVFGDKTKEGEDKTKEGKTSETTQITNNATENAATIVTAQQESTQQLITAFQEVGQNIVSAVKGEDPNANNGEAGEQQEQNQEQGQQNQQQGQQNQQQSGTQQQTSQPENQQQTQEQGQNAQPENQQQTQQQSGQQNAQTESQQQTPQQETQQQESGNNPQPQQQNPNPDAGGESDSGGNKLGRMGKIGGLLGKIVGGIGNIYGGIFKIVATAAMQLSGFKTIIKLVKSVITTAIKPLNKLFKQIVKTMKPILKTLTSALTKLVEGMTKILTSILEKLTPFLEPLFNVVTDIMGAIGDDLISIITGIVKLLNPLVEGILKVAIPIIKTLHGVLEALFGGVMMGLGKLVYGIGAIISDVNVFKLESLKSVALKMMQQGNDLALAGQGKFYSGMARTIDAWSSPKVTNDNSQTTTDNSKTTVDNSQTTTNNSQTTVDNSQTTTNNSQTTVDNSQTTTNNSQTTVDNSQTTVINQETASEIIGSGDTQASYGTFMNMNKHGCGPIALAENINRRNSLGVYGSGDVDPRSLTVGMYNAGLYNENKGTSVADYLATSRALGYNMTAGGVDYRSLKQASPTNPITLVGSGTGFGTKTGNTHYINVVGNDGVGSAYVSNPLTGRISKASMSELALNSKLGIYGSGPDDEKKSTVTATEQAKIDAKAAEINKTETEAKVKEATETKSGTPVVVKKKDDETVGEIDKAKSDNLVKDVEDNTVEVERHGLEKAGHATVTTASGAAVGAGIGTAIVPGLGTLIGAIGGGLVGLLGGLFSKKDISDDPQQRRIELERQIHSGNYNADEVKVLRRILEDDIAGRLNDNNVYVVGDDVDDSGDYSDEPASINTINPEDLDFSAESIVDRYGTSTTISTLISGLKDLAANFLSIFNPEDTSTEEGQQKYLKRLKKEMGSDAYNQLRAYAFLQFFKEYPPTGLENCEPGSTGAGIYAARFKMHEYDYIKKYKDLVTTNLNNKLFLFPEADLKKFANEAGISVEELSSLNAQQLAEALCGNIDGLSSGSVNAALLAAESADSAARAGMNSSNAEFNNTAYTGSDGKTYKALGFTPQLTMPSTDNDYYKSGNKIGGWDAGGRNQHPTLSMLANCSGYAYGRVHEAVGATSPMYYSKKNGIGRDGGSWIQLAQAHGYDVDLKGESPRPGDVISWKGGQNGGHVAIVEEVKDKDHITIAHSAWNGFKGYSGDKLYFQTKELSRGSNASNPWQVWGDSWKFQGFAHHPDIQYEIANNGSAAYGDPSQLFSNGGSVDENIYRYLISKGMSGVGAAGMMGCMKEESGLKSNNLEDKFQKSWGYPTGDSGDVQYTQNVNSGKETQNMFVNSHGTGKAGYGLTQFTASNVKQALYNNTVAKDKSIDDYGAQLDSVLDTLKGSRYNGSTLYDAISNSTDPVTANKLFLWRYEAGTGFTSDSAVATKYPWMGMEGINKRHTNASAYYNKFKGLSPYTPQQSGSNSSAINPYADQQFVSGAIGGTGGKDSLIKTTASIYEAYEKVMPKTFDKRYQNSLYSKPITLRNGKTRKLRPDCSGIVSAGIQEMGYKLKGIGDDGKRSWEFAGPTSNTMILDQNGNPSRDWEVLQFSRDKLQPGDITAGYWKTHGHVSMPIVHLDKTMPQGLDGGGNTNITNSINVAKQLLAGKSYSSVDYGPRSSGHYAMGSSWDSKTGGGAQRIWRYVGGSKDDTTPQYDSRGFKLNTNYHTAYMITRKNGSDILVDSAGNRLGSVMNVKTIAGGGSGFYNSTPKPFRMSSKWQTADKDNWLYDYIDGITGAGDTSSSTTSSVYVPPIDTKNLLSDAVLNQDGNKSTNNYYIAKDSSDERREELNILLSHTFNVRSESMEAILTEMLEELKKRGGSREPVAVPSPATTPSLFNDDIPPQIERLMLG